MANRLSRTGTVTAIAAAFSLVAGPVAAAPLPPVKGRQASPTTLSGDVVRDGRGRGDWGRNGWGRRHHHDGIDAGDVFAGLLIIGAVAAIASAASSKAKSEKAGDGREYRSDEPDRDPERTSPRYGDEPASGSSERDWGRSRSIDAAVDSCVSEVERSSVRVDSVEGIDRNGETGGWHVGGRTTKGDPWNCSVDAEGRVRSVTVNGQAPLRI